MTVRKTKPKLKKGKKKAKSTKKEKKEEKKKILVLDDNKALLFELKENISKFDVIPAETIEEAMRKFLKNDISFIVADVRLKKGKKGQEVFNKLFKKGRSIPGIVFSAYALTESVIEDLSDYGILAFIEKTGNRKRLSQRIQREATKLLNDPKMRFFAVAQKIKEFGLLNTKMGKMMGQITLKKKLDQIYKRKYTIAEENEIKDEMVKIINHYLIPEGNRPHTFPQIGK